MTQVVMCLRLHSALSGEGQPRFPSAGGPVSAIPRCGQANCFSVETCFPHSFWCLTRPCFTILAHGCASPTCQSSRGTSLCFLRAQVTAAVHIPPRTLSEPSRILKGWRPGRQYLTQWSAQFTVSRLHNTGTPSPSPEVPAHLSLTQRA